MILEYMVQQNRPYSALNVFDNLRGVVKKPQVIKVLDHLAELGKVQAKDFGKARVYLVDQKSLPTSTEAEIAQLDEEIRVKQAAVDELSDEVKQLKDKMKERSRLLTSAQLQDEIQKLRAESERQQKELDASEGIVPVSDEERAVVQKRLLAMQQAAKARQRICMSIVHMFSDMMEQKPQVVMEKIGME
eukprot:CAMPEP_0204898440 /NCGR_PEP_ID=MMETSP1397-20131031/1296_1 /ASSEMBLY_ACC=CAM_ASM_000891 /TAXON_ID=49980 /ORGANISM="Climacostomum Climacostomum virens, Strain Stock W-24" /LENGTH=188 /DNA_ID=CAMNT_0052066291 /DNA_START=120 /DNA_END=683 /DNA_ORIENTATION=-